MGTSNAGASVEPPPVAGDLHRGNLPENYFLGPPFGQRVGKKGYHVNRDSSAFFEYLIDIFERFH